MSPRNRAIAFYNRGIAYNVKAELDNAIADYGEALRLDPAFAAAFVNRGILYRSKGDTARSISDFDEAIRLDPKLAPAYLNRGLAQGAAGNLDRSIADFDVAIAIEPKFARAFFNRGLAYRAKGNLDRAIADYSAAILLEPELRRCMSIVQSHITGKASTSERSPITIRPSDLIRPMSGTPKPLLDPRFVGRASEALSDCSEALRIKQDDVNALDWRGWQI